MVDIPVEDTVGYGDLVTDKEETAGVISGVRVMRVLKRLGGAMLSSQCVVLLTTEK